MVLGSGLLQEIALPTLVSAFDRVVLADAVHLWPTRRSAHAVGAELATVDLSGCVSWSLGQGGRRADPFARWRHDPVDFVLSANLMSQLPMSFERWLERHPLLPGVDPSAIAGRLAAWHLGDLMSLNARICLLTDIRHREFGQDGLVVDETDLLFGQELPQPDEVWDWEVAPRGEAGRGTHVHRMHAYGDLGGSFRSAGVAEPAAAR